MLNKYNLNRADNIVQDWLEITSPLNHTLKNKMPINTLAYGVNNSDLYEKNAQYSLKSRNYALITFDLRHLPDKIFKYNKDWRISISIL